MTRQTTFLSQPEWLTIPFEMIPKDSFHQLVDLMLEFCSILEDFDLGHVGESIFTYCTEYTCIQYKLTAPKYAVKYCNPVLFLVIR